MRLSRVASMVVLAVTLPGAGVSALWDRLSQAELIGRSNLIAVGELTSSTEEVQTADGRTLHVGLLRIDEVLKGGGEPREERLLLPSPDAPRSSSDIVYTAGQSGLWYLRLQHAAELEIFIADHPQRFVPIERAADQLELLRQQLR